MGIYRSALHRRTALWMVVTVAVGALFAGISQTKAEPPESLVKAAKQEGKVVVDGPPLADVREALTKGFQQKYGIEVMYISSGTSKSGSRVRAERAAGKYLLDVFLSGADTPLLTFKKSGWLEKIESALVDPDVTNPKDWSEGHLWYLDPDRTVLRLLRYVTPELVINTKQIKPGEITKWSQLLEPKWKGKIAAKDPAVSGAGASLISYFYLYFGKDYVQALYQTQTPTITRNARQMAEWVATGEHPIGVGADSTEVERFQKAGYPVAIVMPTDGPGILSGGWGALCLMNKAPDPNAAKLFVNWLASKEGQTIYSKAANSLSLRKDVPTDWAPAYLFPKKGDKYLDTYAYDFIIEKRDAAFKRVRELLGL
jgi:iron(III) transport system substrate-binding protein